MTTRVSVLAAMLCLALCAACGGGGGVLAPMPGSGVVSATQSAAGAGRIYAAPGAADAGTVARLTVGGTAQATVATDGSFMLHLDPCPAEATVLYEKQGQEYEEDVTFITLASRVEPQLFSTGSAPNDMLLADGAIYIANSLDNTVTKYGLDGAQLASSSFPLYASPSFLALGEGSLWVVSNGDNKVTALDQSAMAAVAGQTYELVDPAMAFIGPSQPCVLERWVFVPRNQFTSFSPTAYGAGKLTCIDTQSQVQTELTTVGHNPQYSAVDSARGIVYVVCTGEIQFDEQWHPYATGNSTLEAYAVAQDMALTVSLNLGPVGAGRIALSPDGNTAFFGNGLTGDVYEVDLVQMQALHGQSNPITLTDEFTYISDVAFTPDGQWLLATSFNTDELYVIDPVTGEVNPGPYPEPFNLSLSDEMLAGCGNIEISPRVGDTGKFDVYVLYAVANAVVRVRLL